MTPVRSERRGDVAWIKLDRPDVYNAFDEEMGAAFIATLGEAADPSVRAVVLTGEGKAFCAGEDLRALASEYADGKAPDLAAILRRRYNPAVSAIQALDKPVIAAINGVAAGAGVALALACDLRIMSEQASLVLAFSKVGLVPDSGATWLLPRYVGIGRAIELSMAGDPIDAARALELGLVNRLAPRDELFDSAEKWAAELAAGPTAALGLMKKLLWGSSVSRLVEHLEDEADAQGKAGFGKDHSEGVAAFMGKRPPAFKGR